MTHDSRPLLVSDDDLLLEDLLRLAAAAGATPDVARDVGTAQRGWPAASLVLVGADLARELARCTPPRRTGVHVMSREHVPDEAFRWALELGAEHVAELPMSESWLVEVLTDAADGGVEPGVTIGVLGGSGGAGATVFSGALALTLGRERQTLLLDADPLGAGIDRVLGMESVPGARWDAISSTTGRLSGRHLRDSLPRRDGVSVLTWTGDRAVGLQDFVVREVLSAGQRGHQAVVVDLPRHPGQTVDEVLARCDHLVLVAASTVPAVTAASRVARRLSGLAARQHLVLRGTGGLAPEQVAGVLRIPLVAAMADQRGLDEAIDLGAGPVRSRRGSLARAARAVADRVTAGEDAAADARIAAGRVRRVA